MRLEELIQDMVERGEMTHLSLSPVLSGKRQLWEAKFCAASPAGGYTLVSAEDPVEALCGAIENTKLRKRRGNARGPSKGQAEEAVER